MRGSNKSTKNIYTSSSIYISGENTYKLSLLEKTITLVLYSGYLLDEKPLSLLIVASPESGKSEILRKFYKNKGIKILTEATAFGIMRDILPKIEAGEVKHLIFPDLLKPLSKSPPAVSSFISFMNSLIEEGVIDYTSFYQTLSSLQRTDGLKCGMIGAVISDMVLDGRTRKKWRKMGFLSRCIPFSYSYNKEIIEDILLNYTVKQQYSKEDNIILKFPKKDKRIKLSEDYAKEFLPITRVLAEAEKTYGFRHQRQFQTLLKANALVHGRAEVNSDDVDEIKKIVGYINLKFNNI